MNTFEDRLQVALRDLADDVGQEPPFRWVAPVEPAHRTPHRVLAVAAAVVLAVLLTASVVVLRQDRSAIVDPVQRPPRVVHLSGSTSSAPGPAVLAFTLSPGSGGDAPTPLQDGAWRAYLLRAGTDRAVELVPADDGVRWFGQQLTAGGDHVMAQTDPYIAANDSGHDSRFRVLDLRSGTDVLDGARGLCPELSPDGGAVAFHRDADVVVLDTATGRRTRLVRDQRPAANNEAGCAGGLGWTADAALLAIGHPSHHDSGTAPSTEIFRRSSELVVSLPGHLANNSMSWTPDGTEVLLYDNLEGTYRVGALDGTSTSVTIPTDAYRAMGWAGSRIVWLVGSVGDQRLVTTDRTGGDLQPWLRFDVGDVLVTSVQWSRDLGGSAR